MPRENYLLQTGDSALLGKKRRRKPSLNRSTTGEFNSPPESVAVRAEASTNRSRLIEDCRLSPRENSSPMLPPPPPQKCGNAFSPRRSFQAGSGTQLRLVPAPGIFSCPCRDWVPLR
eukprot:2245056-Pyramimonas_sp.AAC.1